MSDTTSVSMKPGDSVMVRLDAVEPGGYAVKLLPNEADGFLPSTVKLAIGKVVPATFVCMNANRALLTYAFMVGTTERVQLSTLSNEENAFSVWADSHPGGSKLRRAIDMIMPPFGEAPPFKVGVTLDSIREELINGRFTGCIKAESEKNMSRSAALLYDGRGVGAIFGKKPMLDSYAVEIALALMFGDLQDPETKVLVYPLPETLVLSTSALFLGCQMSKSEESEDSNQFFDSLVAEVRAQEATVCLTLNDAPVPRALGFFFKGFFSGLFLVNEQEFVSDISFLRQLINKESNVRLEAFMLPPEMMSHLVRYGYDLRIIEPKVRH